MLPTRADPASRRSIAVAAMLLVSATSAGWPPPSAASQPTPPPIPVHLPTLPAPHERLPGLFDESGCALLAVDEGARKRICPAPQPSARVVPGGWHRLLGYEGPHYATSVTGAGVELLPATIGVAREEIWSALGMVRNDTPWTLNAIEVAATLEAPDGASLETVRAVVPVRSVRPGEPAPFALSSTTRRAAVKLVRWETTYRRAASSSPDSSRRIEVSLVRALSDARHSGLPDGDDPDVGDGSSPATNEIAWGTLRSWSESPIRRPAVVALWLDADGRALALGSARVWESIARRVRSLVALAPGNVAEFTLTLPDIAAEARAKPTVALWGTPS